MFFSFVVLGFGVILMLAKGYGKWEVVAPYICLRPFRQYEGGAMSRLRVLRAPILPGSVAEGGCSQEAPPGLQSVLLFAGFSPT